MFFDTVGKTLLQIQSIGHNFVGTGLKLIVSYSHLFIVLVSIINLERDQNLQWIIYPGQRHLKPQHQVKAEAMEKQVCFDLRAKVTGSNVLYVGRALKFE